MKTELNEYEMDISNLKSSIFKWYFLEKLNIKIFLNLAEINDLRGNFTEELTKHENELNSLYCKSLINKFLNH